MIYVNILLFLVLTALCLIFLFGRKDRSKNKLITDLDPAGLKVFSKAVRIVLIALIAVFVLLRIYRFGEIPGGAFQDGAMAAVDGKALAYYGTDRFGTRFPAYFWAWDYAQMNVLMSYLMIPFIKLFGLNAVTMRLPILIVSLLGLGAVFLITRKLVSFDGALVATLFAAIDPWHFMESRWALESNMFPHMFILGFVCLIYGIKKKPFIYFSMVFFALCMYSYAVSFFMVPVFLLAAAIVLVRSRLVKFRHVLLSGMLYFLLSFPIYFTMFINVAGIETVSLPFVTMQYFTNSVRANDLLVFSDNPLKQLTANVRSVVEVVFLQKQDHRLWNSIEDFGTIYLCSIPVALLGFYICLRRAIREKDAAKKVPFVLMIIYVACSLLMGVFIDAVNVNRINVIFYSSIIFIGIGLYSLLSWKKIGAYIVSLTYGILSVVFVSYYFTVWSLQIKNWFYADFLEALDYADTIDFDRCYITPDTQYTGSVDVSEILTLYELDIDISYFQGKTNVFDNREIPYKERYVYSNPASKKPEPEKNTVYIIRNETGTAYDFSGWSLKEFGRFSVYTYG